MLLSIQEKINNKRQLIETKTDTTFRNTREKTKTSLTQIYPFFKTIDPDQLASKKSSDQDPLIITVRIKIEEHSA